MLKFVFVALIAVGTVAMQESLPPYKTIQLMAAFSGLLTALGVYFQFFIHVKAGARILHNGLFLGALFCGVFAWSAYSGQHYLEVRSQLSEKQTWLVQVKTEPRYRYRRGQARLQLICRYIPRGERQTCDQTLGHPLGFNYEVLASFAANKDSHKIFRQPGDYWKVTLEFSAIERATNPGFDKSRWALAERLVANAKVEGGSAYFVRQSKGISYWRHWLGQQFYYDSFLEASTYSGLSLTPIVEALTLGNRDGMTDQHWDLFRATGTSHLMAISGLHLGILTGWVYWLVSWVMGRMGLFNRHFYPNVIAAGLALACGAAYSAMVGFSLPTQRAFLMLLFGFAALLSHRPKLILDSLACALLLILFLQPFSVLTASLWLSFGAVLLVCLVIANRFSSEPSKQEAMLLGLKTQWVIFIGMLPLTAYFFAGVSVSSVLANIVAIPVVTLVLLPLSFIYAGCSIMGGTWKETSGEVVRYLLDSLFCCLQWLVETCGGLFSLSLSLTDFVLCMVAALVLCAPINKALRVLGALIFCSVLVGAIKDTSTSLTLYEHPYVLAVFNQAGSKMVLDEVPGLRGVEQFKLRQGEPLLHAQLMRPLKKESWLQQGWILRRSNQASAHLEHNPLCEKPATDKMMTELLIQGLAGGSCLFAFTWADYRWLVLGHLSFSQQQRLVDSGWLREPYDFVLLAGERFRGALLNRFQGSQVMLWNGDPLAADMLDRFKARSITLHQLSVSGALTVDLSKPRPQIKPLIKPRFYHFTN